MVEVQSSAHWFGHYHIWRERDRFLKEDDVFKGLNLVLVTCTNLNARYLLWKGRMHVE